MARHRDTRSPSPTGSVRSSKRARKDDNYRRDRKYDRRDDDRITRRRTRSRSPDRNHGDRDNHRRRDRSIDRRDDDRYRSGRRDRSWDRRDRNTQRDRSPDRPRRVSRERDPRDRRDDRDDRDQDRDRRRRESPIGTRRRRRDEDPGNPGGRGDGSKSTEISTSSSKATAPVLTEAEKKAERLAKLEAWKRKMAEDKERKEQEVSAGGTRKLLDEMDQKANSSPVVLTPTSPISSGPPTPVAYAGKFDPKAIMKRATHNSAVKALGEVVATKDIAKMSALSKNTGKDVQADHRVEPTQLDTKASTLPKTRSNLNAFGIAVKSTTDAEKSTSKRALDLGDDDNARKKLEKLLPIDADQDAAFPAPEDPGQADDDDAEQEDVDNEEEAAAAARAAAEKREERLHEQMQQASSADLGTDANADVAMQDISAVPAQDASTSMEVDEEVDPLDAFMDEMGDPFATSQSNGSFIKSKVRSSEPQAMFGDDDLELKTIETDPDDIMAMANKARKKKELPTINYAKLNLPTFRKNFYTEPEELADMSEADLADLRLELDGIKVAGDKVPKPVQKWSQCGLNIQSLEVIRKLGYEQPTAIQSQAIPAIMSGRDVIGVAKTGSGKTIAFLLPMFRHIRDQPPLESTDGPIGLILTPTRELATQIHKECKPFVKAMGLRAVCAYGGAPIKDQIAELKRGAEIIVCTPGRMVDLLAANSGRVTNLRRVTYAVCDEADRMFDMGLEPQVMKIFANIRPTRQTIMFSATMPRIMEALAKKTLSSPVEITVGGRSIVAPEITQIVEVREEGEKFIRLLELLGELYDRDEDARTLIFVNRQEKADDLLKELLRKGYPCMSIHGGKDQIDRDSTIDDFKAGVVPIMIATSVAARGLDVKQLRLVINYDAPNHLEDYVHRAGRTGRAGETGTAVTFVTEEQEQFAPGIAKALEQSGQPIPEKLNDMRKAWRDKVKAGKAKDSSGFGGKGLERFDAEREAARLRERKTHKTEGDDEEEKEETAGEDLVLKAASSVQASNATPVTPVATAISGVPKGIDLDGKITVHRTETSAPSSSNSGSRNPLDKVTSAIDAINARLNKTGQLRSGVPIDNKGPDAGAFHATLEINDFPQKARWAVTNRTNVAKILEATGTSITTKGNFYPAGKEVPAGGEPKLYILVEGDTELVVTNAMRELMRLLKEGAIAAAEAEGRGTAGRYSVV